MNILHWLHLLVSGQTSAHIPKHLLALMYYSGSFKYILLVSLHLLCVPLCNGCFPRPFFSLVPLGLCRTTTPLVWTLPSSRYSLFSLPSLAAFSVSLGNSKCSSTSFKASSLRILHLNEHALLRSPSWISRLPCGTRLFLCQQLFVVLFAIRTSPSHATCVENTSLSLHK
ncbi:hypothetical protein Acr_00g0038250 [Actinidia rufa]|uniref:Uncharacterized protein n=1 Tax=Actinidia rufa TaxID=165716 RepID=A0A7J0DJ05_9ERIC|nr:hypothetical protein Acr_00g0038250 [Actinidia rufa]